MVPAVSIRQGHRPPAWPPAWPARKEGPGSEEERRQGRIRAAGTSPARQRAARRRPVSRGYQVPGRPGRCWRGPGRGRGPSPAGRSPPGAAVEVRENSGRGPSASRAVIPRAVRSLGPLSLPSRPPERTPTASSHSGGERAQPPSPATDSREGEKRTAHRTGRFRVKIPGKSGVPEEAGKGAGGGTP